jgi:hypothetical protein
MNGSNLIHFPRERTSTAESHPVIKLPQHKQSFLRTPDSQWIEVKDTMRKQPVSVPSQDSCELLKKGVVNDTTKDLPYVRAPSPSTVIYQSLDTARDYRIALHQGNKIVRAVVIWHNHHELKESRSSEHS